MTPTTLTDVVTATRCTANLAVSTTEKAEAAVERVAELVDATAAAKRATDVIAATVPTVIKVAIATIFELPPVRKPETLEAITNAATRVMDTATREAVEATTMAHVQAAVVEGNIIDTANAASSTVERAAETIATAEEAKTDEATAALEVECPLCHNLITDAGCLLCRGRGTINSDTGMWYRDNYEV